MVPSCSQKVRPSANSSSFSAPTDRYAPPLQQAAQYILRCAQRCLFVPGTQHIVIDQSFFAQAPRHLQELFVLFRRRIILHLLAVIGRIRIAIKNQFRNKAGADLMHRWPGTKEFHLTPHCRLDLFL